MYEKDEFRIDLAREFRANPYGSHSPDLEYLLQIMLRPSMQPFHILIEVTPCALWELALVNPGTAQEPQRLEVVFDSLEDAEWYVFKDRWERLTGTPLEIEGPDER